MPEECINEMNRCGEIASENKNLRQKVSSIISFLFVVILTIYLVITRDNIQHLGTLGYPGIFLISLLTHATIIIPMPTVLLTSALGAIFDPLWVALIAGLGASLGEMTGFIAGAGGREVINKSKWFELTNRLISGKYGGPAILFLAFIPNPLFDLAGMIAGASKIPIFLFFFWCLLGKVLKMLVFSYGGDILVNYYE